MFFLQPKNRVFRCFGLGGKLKALLNYVTLKNHPLWFWTRMATPLCGCTFGTSFKSQPFSRGKTTDTYLTIYIYIIIYIYTCMCMRDLSCYQSSQLRHPRTGKAPLPFWCLCVRPRSSFSKLALNSWCKARQEHPGWRSCPRVSVAWWIIALPISTKRIF